MFVKMDAYNVSVLILFLLLFIYAIRSAKKEQKKMDNTNKRPLKMVKMRTIKDSHWFETLIDEDLFIPKTETKTEIYGLYGKTKVAIKKENK